MISTVSSADAVLLRGNAHSVRPYVFAIPATTVATARINQSSFSYPIAQLTVDDFGDWADVKPGMMYWIGSAAGAYDITVGVVVKQVTSTVLYIDAKSLGDPGLARNINGVLADDQYVTILKYYPPYTLFSRIYNQEFFKMHNVGYTNQMSNPSPICNIGDWDFGFVQYELGEMEFALEARAFAWGSKTIASIEWDVDGNDVVAGAPDEFSLTISCPVGFYVIEAEVTDSGGATAIGRKYVWVRTRSGDNAPFSERYAIGWASDRQTAKGRQAVITIMDSTTKIPDLFPMQAFLYTEEQTFNGEVLSQPVTVDRFAAYGDDDARSYGRDVTSYTITVRSPMLVVKDMGSAPQHLTEVANPTGWEHMPSALSNPAGATWYILRWHAPALLENHDFIIPKTGTDGENPLMEYTDQRKQTFVFQSDSLGSQLAMVESLMIGLIGSTSGGATIVRPYWYDYFDLNERAELDTWFLWAESDFVGDVEYPFIWRVRSNAAIGYAFAYGGGNEAVPFGAIAPGRAGGQGVGRPTLPSFIVPIDENQDRVSTVAGLAYAKSTRRNALMRFKVNRNMDIFDPAYGRIHRINASRFEDDTGRKPFVQTETVMRTWRNTSTGLVKEIVVEFGPEWFGQQGEMLPIERGGAWDWLDNGWLPAIIVPFDPLIPDFDFDVWGLGIPWNNQNAIGWSNTFLSELVAWDDDIRGASFNGEVNDMTGYYNPGGDLCLWVASVDTDTNTVYLYFTDEADAINPTWSAEHDFVISDDGWDGNVRIVACATDDDFQCVGWTADDGVHLLRRYGTAWGSASAIHLGHGAAFDWGCADHRLGMVMDDTTILVGGLQVYIPENRFQLFRAQNGAAFAGINPGTPLQVVSNTIVVDGQGNAFVAGYAGDETSSEIETETDTAFSDAFFDDWIDTSAWSDYAPGSINTGGIGSLSSYAGYVEHSKEGDGNWGYPLSGIMKLTRTITFESDTPAVDALNSAIIGVTYRNNSTTPNAAIDVNWSVKVVTKSAGTFEDNGSFLFGAPGGVYTSDYLSLGGGISRYYHHWEIDTISTLATDNNDFEGMEIISVEVSAWIEGTRTYDVDAYWGWWLGFHNLRMSGSQYPSLETHFYRVDDYAGTPVWTDIEPVSDTVPMRSYAIGVDPDNELALAAVVHNSTGVPSLYISEDAGDNWMYVDSTRVVDFWGCKRSGAGVLGFGQTGMHISDDYGLNWFPRNGNWNSAIGVLGIIQGMVLVTL